MSLNAPMVIIIINFNALKIVACLLPFFQMENVYLEIRQSASLVTYGVANSARFTLPLVLLALNGMELPAKVAAHARLAIIFPLPLRIASLCLNNVFLLHYGMETNARHLRQYVPMGHMLRALDASLTSLANKIWFGIQCTFNVFVLEVLSIKEMNASSAGMIKNGVQIQAVPVHKDLLILALLVNS